MGEYTSRCSLQPVCRGSGGPSTPHTPAWPSSSRPALSPHVGSLTLSFLSCRSHGTTVGWLILSFLSCRSHGATMGVAHSLLSQLQESWGYRGVAQMVKNLQCGRPGLIPGLGRCPGYRGGAQDRAGVHGDAWWEQCDCQR